MQGMPAPLSVYTDSRATQQGARWLLYSLTYLRYGPSRHKVCTPGDVGTQKPLHLSSIAMLGPRPAAHSVQVQVLCSSLQLCLDLGLRQQLLQQHAFPGHWHILQLGCSAWRERWKDGLRLGTPQRQLDPKAAKGYAQVQRRALHSVSCVPQPARGTRTQLWCPRARLTRLSSAEARLLVALLSDIESLLQLGKA